MSLSLNLKNKKVFVTGSTLGIGFGCAKQFAKEGCQVNNKSKREHTNI
jgi:NAD(P)-dependent dehydrogenase (short-subunit alcohol dehydrogenase family)